jgi:hypothetical protein
MKLNYRNLKSNEIDSHDDMFTDECIERMLKSPTSTNISIDEIRELNTEIMRHSISYRYKSVRLAINDPDRADEFKLWNEYSSKIDNVDIVKRGYFWLVEDAELI